MGDGLKRALAAAKATRKRKGGPRPDANKGRISKAKPRTKALEIRLTFEDFEKLQEIARVLDMTPKAYVQWVLRKRFQGSL